MRHSTLLKHELAGAGLRWLPLFLTLLLAIPLAFVLGVVRFQLKDGWHPVHSVLALNDAAVVALLAVAMVAALPAILIQRWLLTQLRAEAIRAENDAVARVCEAVAREFAQPLTGTLAYSELLLMDSQTPSESQRRALDGLREGIARLDHLLYSVRGAVHDLPAPSSGEHVADSVMLAVNRRVQRSPIVAHDTARTPVESGRRAT